MVRQIWRHNRSGEAFAVEMEDAKVVGAAGPLHYSELRSVIEDGFDGDPELAEDIDGSQDEYRLSEDAPKPNLKDTFIRNLDQDLYRRLRARAVERAITTGDAMNEAMALWLEQNPTRPSRQRNIL